MAATIILAAAGLCIASIHDGDTLRLCDGERFRLSNIDAPDLQDSPRCSPQKRQRVAGPKIATTGPGSRAATPYGLSCSLAGSASNALDRIGMG